MEERKKEKNVENKAGQEAEKNTKRTGRDTSTKNVANKSSRLIEIDSAELERLNRKIAQNRIQDSRQENRTERKVDNKVEGHKQEKRIENAKIENRIDNSKVQKVDNNKTDKMKKKKRKLTVLFVLLGILLMLVVGFFLGKVLYKYIKVDNSQINEFMNTLNGGNQNEEENVLSNIISEPSPTPTEEEPTEAPTDKPKDIPYYIKVNYGANTVTVYKKDKNGEYNTPVKAFICSTGTATPTSGVYPITDQYTWRLLERKCIWTICL